MFFFFSFKNLLFFSIIFFIIFPFCRRPLQLHCVSLSGPLIQNFSQYKHCEWSWKTFVCMQVCVVEWKIHFLIKLHFRFTKFLQKKIKKSCKRFFNFAFYSPSLYFFCWSLYYPVLLCLLENSFFVDILSVVHLICCSCCIGQIKRI